MYDAGMTGFRSNDWTRPSPPDTDATRTGAPDRGPDHPPGAAAAPRTLAPPVMSPRVSRRRSSRQHVSSSRKKLRIMKVLLAAMLAVIVAGVVVAIFVYSELTRFRIEAGSLGVQVRQLEAELLEARERLVEMNDDLRILLANRIPGVAEMSFSRPIEINDQYVKTLTFVRSGIDGDQGIGFSAVLENTRSTPIVPQATISLFDDSGLQLGAATLAKTQDRNGPTSAEMQPGEGRQYVGTIDLQRQAPPKYFTIEVR
jgi:hypothetical protein